MTLARNNAITECLRAAEDAMRGEKPGGQARRIIAQIRSLIDPSVRVTANEARVDYLRMVQEASRQAYVAAVPSRPDQAAYAEVETPLGLLRSSVWRVSRAGRWVWHGVYTLAGVPLSVREIRARGLAMRPKQRARG